MRTEPIVGKYVPEKMLCQCTTCGACEYQCPVGIQHCRSSSACGGRQVNTGKWEDDHGGKLFLNLERNGNALGMAASERDKFIQKNAHSRLRRLAGILPVAGLHGLLRSARARDHPVVDRGVPLLGVTFGVLQEGEVHGRSGAAAWQRLSVHRTRREQPRADQGVECHEDDVDLPALRADDRRGLEGGRRRRPDRASQRVPRHGT